MLTPIRDELLVLEEKIQTLMQVYVDERNTPDTSNPLYIEFTGRISGLYEALGEIQETMLYVDMHIENILANTIDGNYAAKLDVLEEENEALRKSVSLSKEEIAKITKIKKGKPNIIKRKFKKEEK